MTTPSGESSEQARFELLAELVELSADERERVLAGCDPKLASEVRAMLEADDTRDDFLGVDEAREAREAALGPQLAPPASIGPYRLVEPLGEGGMGRVFLAEQVEPVHRRVALKLLRFSVASKEARSRFQAEGQAMGRLEHPNVGRLIEAGTTEAGIPFLVMELIEGPPVTRYCDERQLSVEERIRLFIEVCRGVEHAHRKLVLHRDIKPSNVLVPEVDGRPLPKLIDFGIAKGLDQPLADGTLSTRDGFVGTPTYMSPEALGLGGDVDTRSDVFSLGVLLFELLTGGQPWHSDVDSPAATFKARLEKAADRASEHVSALDPVDLLEAAEARSTTPVELVPRLAGDLDWVLLRAFAREPKERYGSASELADDLERHLADRTVSARPPSSADVLKKLIRRNRGRFAAAAALVVAVLLGILGTTAGLMRARGEAERANIEALDARRARERSDELATFLTEMLQSADPNKRSEAAQVTARELVDRAAERIGSDLEHQPEVLASLESTIGSVYLNWGLPAEAAPLLESALTRLESLHPEPHGDTVETLRLVAKLHSAEGRYQDSFDQIERALELDRQLGHPDRERRARLLSRASIALWRLSRLDEASSHAREALTIMEGIDGVPPDHLAPLYTTLAVIEKRRERWAESAELTQRAIELYLAADPGHPRLHLSLNNLGNVLMRLGQLEESEASFRKALAVLERTVGPDALANANKLNNLGITVRRLGRVEEAVVLHRRALEVDRKWLRPTHPTIATHLLNLGTALELVEPPDLAEVRRVYQEALEVSREGGGGRPSVARVAILAKLGSLARNRGDLGSSERHLREALGELDRFEDPLPERRGGLLLDLARTLREGGAVSDAAGLLQDAVALLDGTADTETLATARRELGELDAISTASG